ncbi:hypothetical protein Pst134EA_019382 [Puccinia striiformis f. sp. tritici]|uniref:hypothetical protein n=1 Tax=Puccinia striiformis f. sp. tritici TaxID=168172 RepID=UPI0020072789|nr:hypothetical protein Pst134EA_019382 [Puccinia striiformis f. sp. tritici]KAH9459232.1 hypothetical protein Pst134EA_019382 [Puccinia striiformis f. sp. tritici]
MHSMKFFVVLITITLGGQAVQAADPAFDSSAFKCEDKNKPNTMCLGTKVKSAKQRKNYWSEFQNQLDFFLAHNQCCCQSWYRKKSMFGPSREF